jgi:hypothetical protein
MTSSYLAPASYVGILIFLILPGIYLFGLLLIPIGMWLRRHSLRGRGELPSDYPAIDLACPWCGTAWGMLGSRPP